jgi:phosphate transport system ATP-binding protein
MSDYKIDIQDLTVSYGKHIALENVSIQVPRNGIFAIIGPSNSGKTTLLKCINRTLEFIPKATAKGTILIDGIDVARSRQVCDLRRRIGMVFPLPVGLPLSIYDNVAYAPRRAGLKNKKALNEIVERCLRQAALWDEVKDRLDMLGTMLSGGQQARRLGDLTCFLNMGKVVQVGETELMFSDDPGNQLTYDYVQGVFG